MKRKQGKPSTYGDGPIYNLKTFVNLTFKHNHLPSVFKTLKWQWLCQT